MKQSLTLEPMRIFRRINMKFLTTSILLLIAVLGSSMVHAHVRLLDPLARTDDSGLVDAPCGKIPEGPPTATYLAGSEIEITAQLVVLHTPTLRAFISHDKFLTKTELAMISVPGEGEFKMNISLPAEPLGSAILQVTDGTYVSCADISLVDTAPFQITAGLNDAWFNPVTNGQGFLIAVFPDIKQLFVAWFTYDTERPAEGVSSLLGEPGHRWLTAQGPYSQDTANLTLFLTQGGVFDAATPAASTDLAGDGTMTIEFADCTEGLVKYEITSLGISGEIPIERIAPDNIAFCESLASP